MDEILIDTTATSVMCAIEGNLFSWLPVLGGLDGAQVDDIPGVRRCITNISMPFFNSILQTQLTPENVESTVEVIKADANKRNVPVIWWVGPSARPEDIASRLLSHGFVVDEDGPAMAVELAQLNEALPVAEGVSIHLSNDESSWWSWCRAMMEGFEAPPARFDFGMQQWYDLLRCADPSATRAFTAWQNGKPVATSLLQLGGGVAGIYAVATIPSARRQGIGALVTLYPLQQARSLGYRIGVLEASEMGLPVYRSLGFREYGWITSYLWRPVAG
jgi:GNAT superfamily N-acetyltransferase